MRNRLLVLVGACAISLLSLNVASVQAQSITVTTSATFLDMLSTFPQAVLSTINSVVLQSTNASSATTPFDSTARKDNLALQMGMWQSGRVGAGVKYWLSEVTALSVYVNTGINLGLGLSGNFSVSANNSNSFYSRDSSQSKSSSNGQSFSPFGSPSVTLNLGLSATIEKHLFAKRNLSPFVGFGMGLFVNSTNYSNISGNSSNSRDTNGTRTYFNGIYYDPNAQSQQLTSRQTIVTQTSVNISAHILAGAEYFVLPSISLAAQVAVFGGLTGNFSAESRLDQGLSTSQTNSINSYSPSTSSKQDNQSVTGGVNVNVSAGIGFSSSLTLSLYFGRNVLGDIVNAFTSGTLFQW